LVLTSLSHHIDIEFLREAYRLTRKDGAAGVDGRTAQEYAENLEANLQGLLGRFKSGAYKAPPVRRVLIPKGDGKQMRPIGIPTFEDKVLQRAVTMLLEAVYEQDFLDCSYGFRRGRSPHKALQALWETLMPTGGGWVLEVDIRKFFDHLDHSQLRGFLDRRVRDGVVRRAIDKWLKAGVLEDGSVLHHVRPVTTAAERAFRDYLRCGIPAHGFARVRCAACRHEYLVPFSCKVRDLCPGCATRRMVETAAHLVDLVLPRVPYRQWVLSTPKRVRWHLERKPEVVDGLLRIFLRAIETMLHRCSPDAPPEARFGAVAFVHRFGKLWTDCGDAHQQALTDGDDHLEGASVVWPDGGGAAQARARCGHHPGRTGGWRGPRHAGLLDRPGAPSGSRG
jgi:ribosomal protein S27E